MQVQNRYLNKHIQEDLKEKMVFIGGARQSGKTTLAKDIIAKSFPNFTYLNWDIREHRQMIMENRIPATSLTIFDEVHKYDNWKNDLKGLYDLYGSNRTFLVTGSARLNVYRKGGDSLLGRYHYYTLFPFSLAEILNTKPLIAPGEALNIENNNHFSALENLEKYSAFPELFIKQSERSTRRWSQARVERIFREDIRDINPVRDINKMILLADLLPARVGSPLSINNLREDVNISHRAASEWLEIMETFYYHFRIYPWHKNLARSIKKEAKLYLYDWTQVEDEGSRFENMVAFHLYKYVKFIQEYEGYKVQLYYLRNIDGKELDFLITFNDKPWFSVEAKLNDTSIAPSIQYFSSRLDIPYAYQVVYKENTDYLKSGVRVVSADRLFSALV
jgi:predicted AAA+ superfamily ATPase